MRKLDTGKKVDFFMEAKYRQFQELTADKIRLNGQAPDLAWAEGELVVECDGKTYEGFRCVVLKERK